MNDYKTYPVLQALLAALLFGASAPLAKLLLKDIAPVMMAGFLYLGSGIGLVIFQYLLNHTKLKIKQEAKLEKKDLGWLLGAVIFGGILAPILLMISLKVTPASTSSLLLNFEGVATTVIAIILFKESISPKIGLAILLITVASILLTWDFGNHWGLTIGALGILGACACWGLDNNFTRNISLKNPFTIVIIKGLVAGSFSFLVSLLLRNQIPTLSIILLALLLGFICYGLSIVLFVFAMRSMGSARTSAYFASAPFIGTILSFVVLHEIPGVMFFVSVPLMILGTFFLFKEEHDHTHVHLELEHTHKHHHKDIHHQHDHSDLEIGDLVHSHPHKHQKMEHSHPHLPDIHHRH
jgi:drug/metabolite transporter (DMT)-like permease